VDIYRTHHPTAARNTYFSPACGNFSLTDHVLGHKASLNKFKKFKSYLVIFLRTME
jgi:hypothetical protein